jgi:FKBP-type peptidyl-prolyl cis-trans isomerase FkpA
MSFRILLWLFIGSLSITSCSKEDVMERAEKEIQEYLELRGLTAERTQEGLYYVIEMPGSESKPDLGSRVTVFYRGALTNGNIFDSNFGRQPATFNLTNVIRGWQIGIPKFGRGGKGKLLVPPHLGYGKDGTFGIPANAVLIFDVELLDFE